MGRAEMNKQKLFKGVVTLVCNTVRGSWDKKLEDLLVILTLWHFLFSIKGKPWVFIKFFFLSTNLASKLFSSEVNKPGLLHQAEQFIFV